MNKETVLHIVDQVLPVGPKKVYARKVEFNDHIVRVAMFSHGEVLSMRFFVNKEYMLLTITRLNFLDENPEHETILSAEEKITSTEDGTYVMEPERVRAAIDLVVDDVFKKQIYNDN